MCFILQDSPENLQEIFGEEKLEVNGLFLYNDDVLFCVLVLPLTPVIFSCSPISSPPQ